MNYLNKAKDGLAKELREDANLNRARSWLNPIRQKLPYAALDYCTEKLPVAQWLPQYDYKWLLQDIIAGITIGVMLIPQGLAYAKIATIPVAHGLYSSWIPSVIYFLLGTSKEVSCGPTSILGLLTAEAVAALSLEGYSPAHIASAMAFMVGCYALVVGLLKLGFLLDFVSAPVLSGWISAVALVIGLHQVGSLVGLETGDGTAAIIRDVLGHLDKIHPLTLCIGFTGIAMLWGLEIVGKRWGKTNNWLRFLSTSRAVIALIVYTIISYLVNRNRSEDNYVWPVTKVDTNGILRPQSHDTSLLRKVIPRAFALLIAMSVEHLGVGKAFGLRNNYSIDKSQELLFLGVANMVNSFFGAQACGGAMSRTAVNSECGVKSPVNFLFTAGFIVLTLYKLAPALYWIPKATLAAIIIMAVAHLVSPPRVFYRYWKISFFDFVASMLGLWVTLFTSTEIGLAVSVGFSIVYTLLRLAFPWVGSAYEETGTIYRSSPHINPAFNDSNTPGEVYIAKFREDIIFPNAERLKLSIIDSVKLQFEPASATGIGTNPKERTWNQFATVRISRLRKRKHIIPLNGDIAPLRFLVLDFTMVGFIDTTAVVALTELKAELQNYIGMSLRLKFLNMTPRVQERLERSGWKFAREGAERTEDTDIICVSVEDVELPGKREIIEVEKRSKP